MSRLRSSIDRILVIFLLNLFIVVCVVVFIITNKKREKKIDID